MTTTTRREWGRFRTTICRTLWRRSSDFHALCAQSNEQRLRKVGRDSAAVQVPALPAASLKSGTVDVRRGLSGSPRPRCDDTEEYTTTGTATTSRQRRRPRRGGVGGGGGGRKR